jgi:hypothetical protein
MTVTPAPTHPAAHGAETLEVRLTHGLLQVQVARADRPLSALCGFASRRNGKRPWLFVSRVLGRHVPVEPRVMRAIHRRLAARLPVPLPGPVVVIAMAETAVALGQGVHAAWLHLSRRDDALFLHSTRYRMRHPLLCTFEERHSHAVDHLLYEPAVPADRELLSNSRSLVLIDDEASTGATFAALAHACHARMPKLERIVCVTITDWMGADARARLMRELPRPAECVSLLQGTYHFETGGGLPPVMPDVRGNGTFKDPLLPVNYGRFGLRQPPPLPAHIVAALRVHPGERLLVLGTGEFVYPPYQLARLAAARGAVVRVQATTRSPILNGGDIRDAIEFPDACQDGIPNFLYCVQPGHYDRVLVCYETPPATRQQALLDHLGAQPLYFSHPED